MILALFLMLRVFHVVGPADRTEYVVLVGDFGFKPKVLWDEFAEYLVDKGFRVVIVEAQDFDDVGKAIDGVCSKFITSAEWIYVVAFGFSGIPILRSVPPCLDGFVLIATPVEPKDYPKMLTDYLHGRLGPADFEMLVGVSLDDDVVAPFSATSNVMEFYQGKLTVDLRRISELAMPHLVVTSYLDRLVPWWTTIFGDDLIICGVANFFRRNCSHIELLMGETARNEVFPKIFIWLKYKSRGRKIEIKTPLLR